VFEVIATGGDSALGGDDYDHALADFVLAQTGLKAQRDNDKAAMLVAARAAKEALTDAESVAFRAEVAGTTASLRSDPRTLRRGNQAAHRPHHRRRAQGIARRQAQAR
jgi:molecular chaperone DnaK (HSP70)